MKDYAYLQLRCFRSLRVERGSRPGIGLFFWPPTVNWEQRPRKGPFFWPAAVGMFSVGHDVL